MKYKSLQYFDLYEREAGKNYQFYFDAFDVTQILQGVHRFYPQDNEPQSSQRRFYHERFEEESAIIHALTFGRFLGTGIRMLPTHQAELARLIKQSNNAGNFVFFGKSDHTLRRFLEKDLKFHDKLKTMTEPPQEEFDDNQLRSWIEDKNKDIFKAIFLSYKANYKERMEEMFAGGIIQIESYQLDDIEIHDDYLFTVLSDTFRVNRPRKEAGGNNFSDVAALMYLSRQVKAYNEDNSNRLPVYFDSRNYQSIIPAHIMNTYFRVHTTATAGQDSIPGYALRDHDFFKLYALISYNNTTPVDEDAKYRSFIRYDKSADNLQRSFAGADGSQIVPGVGEWYEKGNEELKDKMMKYIEVDFYKAVINEVKSKKLHIVNDILNWLDKDELNPESAEVISRQNEIFLRHIDAEIHELLRETVIMYNMIQNRIRSVAAVAEKLREDDQDLDIFVHYSLFRFLIPKTYQASLKHFFSQDGLLSVNNELSNFSRITLWNFYYRTVYYKYNKGVQRQRLLDINELYILYGSFWILNLHDKVIDFNSKAEYLRPLDHSLLMLIGACVNRSIGEAAPIRDTGEEASADMLQYSENLEKYKLLYQTIIQVLQERITVSGEEKAAQIKIVLAYLYFHWWTQDGNELVVMRGNDIMEESDYTQEATNYKAVQYAWEAFDYFHAGDFKNSPYYLYSFNIYIYFIIDGASDEEFRKINSLRAEFIDLKGRAKDWHFRYTDTIARNFHRLSKLVPGRDSKLGYIQKAIDVLQSAVKEYRALECRDINEVRAYLDALVNVKGELEIIPK